ncbi:MAG: MarR family transcriptional regulator [Marinosulfonomonas sp.]|nr:MarR family transcriptional regulator [Marinosulfonomonas sp.]
MIAVLTGDLVRSTDLSQSNLERAMAALENGAADASIWQGSDLQFSRHRGDGWQVALPDPTLALRTALFLRAALRAGGKSLSTRIAIAIGQGMAQQTGNLNTASGPVFVASGRALDGLKPPATMVFADQGTMGAVVRLADQISQGWTPAQAKAMHLALVPGKTTRQTMADTLGITRQGIDQALEAAGYGALSNAIDMIEVP